MRIACSFFYWYPRTILKKGIFIILKPPNPAYLWDKNKVRYQLVQSDPATDAAYNWLFFPGGPGIDSSYFATLTPHLTLPGNTWYVDFPNNGSNLIEEMDIKNLDAWLDFFMPTIKNFANPIYVGHSFAAMLPLLYPELEEYLKGLVLFNSAPKVWLSASAEMGKKKGLPDLTDVLTAYMQNPSNDTFTAANKAFAHYYFTPDSFQEGLALLEKTPANPYGPHWWMPKVMQMNYSATWIPARVPTLIIGGSEDAVTPFSLFKEDKRFQRDNIQLAEVPGVAHFPWVGNMQQVQILIETFIKSLH